MRSAEIEKASERAVMVMFLTLGIGLGSAAFTSEGAAVARYVLGGFLVVVATLLGLHRRALNALHAMGGRVLVGFYAIFFPFTGALIFALLPVAIGLGISAGISLRPSFILVAGILGLLALANLITLILNAIVVFRRRTTAP